MESKQQRAKKITSDIRQVLVDDWDPIGIKGFGPDDEYDSYIAGIYRLLLKNPNEDEIVDHLCSIEIEEIGSTIKEKNQLRSVAKRLLGITVFLNE